MDKLPERLKKIVGDRGWVSNPADLQPHVTEWRNRVTGRTPLMVLPDSTEAVAEIVYECSAAGVGIVAQGGNTGMCAGAVPDETGNQILLNLARMDRVRAVDAIDFSMIAEAGCILADLQSRATAAGCYLPLSLGGEGSCQIGGNLATNAGGINVLRYGMTRDLTLGLEVVLADGRIWDGIQTLRKDNAGYDLKQLFIGSEGTLGIITAVALKLYPDPGEICTSLLALPSARDAVSLLAELRSALGDRIQAFELMSGVAVQMVEQHIPGSRLPFENPHEWYVLVDVATGGDTGQMESELERAMRRGLLGDAVIAKNVGEAEQLWRMRHSISEAEKREGPGVKHDVSVPVAAIPEFLERAEARLGTECPAARPIIFGHVGDGNLHYNALIDGDIAATEYEQLAGQITGVVYGLVSDMRGSISAEHGIGILKKDALAKYESAVGLDLMRSVKKALDPGNIMNPGKVIWRLVPRADFT